MQSSFSYSSDSWLLPQRYPLLLLKFVLQFATDMPKQTNILSTTFKNVLCQQDRAEAKSRRLLKSPSLSTSGGRRPSSYSHSCFGIPSNCLFGIVGVQPGFARWACITLAVAFAYCSSGICTRSLPDLSWSKPMAQLILLLRKHTVLICIYACGHDFWNAWKALNSLFELSKDRIK